MSNFPTIIKRTRGPFAGELVVFKQGDYWIANIVGVRHPRLYGLGDTLNEAVTEAETILRVYPSRFFR